RRDVFSVPHGGAQESLHDIPHRGAGRRPGLNPLLQNPYMAIHPPSLYTGFVGMTIPYAFGMAALITGYLDDSWLRAVRRWTMVSWLFLTFGLMLGMIWAYEELGWGGYWMWDPVENAALLPWFTTLCPTLSKAVTGAGITVGPPFFNKWMLPIGLLLLFLTGIGPLLAWRKSSLRNLSQQLMWPAVACAVTLAAMLAFGIRLWV